MKPSPEIAQAAVAAVAAHVLPATSAADNAVIDIARGIATIVEMRSEKHLDLSLALDAIDAGQEALASAIAARRGVIRWRLSLFKLPRELGMDDYGPSCPCEGYPITGKAENRQNA